MHTSRGTRGNSVGDPSPQVAAAIRRAADSFAESRDTALAVGRLPHRAAGRTRVAICDDTPLYLDGLAGAVDDLGMTVSCRSSDGTSLLRDLASAEADVAIIGISQPPTFTIEGIVTAMALRLQRPAFPTLLLSSNVSVEGTCALAALEADGRALGYIKKDRLTGGPQLLSAITQLLDGGTVVDPEVVAMLIAASREDSALDALSARELQTLELVAQGLTNAAIARQMFLSLKTVEANIASLFMKLGLPAESTANRRVLATLTYLKSSQGRSPRQ